MDRTCSGLPRRAGSSWMREEAAGSEWRSSSLSLTSQVALSHDLLFLPVRAGELPCPLLYLLQRDSQLFLPSWLVGELDCGTGLPALAETLMDMLFLPFPVTTLCLPTATPAPSVCPAARAPHGLQDKLQTLELDIRSFLYLELSFLLASCLSAPHGWPAQRASQCRPFARC